jgi:hypothetical protein
MCSMTLDFTSMEIATDRIFSGQSERDRAQTSRLVSRFFRAVTPKMFDVKGGANTPLTEEYRDTAMRMASRLCYGTKLRPPSIY